MKPTDGKTGDLLDRILEHLGDVKGPAQRGEYVAWCPFHPDGQGDPPHRPNLHVSERGFYCHACGAKGGLDKLALHFEIPSPERQEGHETSYDYRDESGDLLFQVVRKPRKRFLQRRPDGNGGWIWKRDGVRSVLYRLPDLAAHPDDRVFVVEGEKDSDKLHHEGLLATTNPCGAGKWRDEYSQLLQGRDVIIIPDNDEPGRNHAHRVALSLYSVANSVKVLDLPHVPEKGDIADWLAGDHTVDGLLVLADETPVWEPTVPTREDAPPAGDEPSKRESQASALVRLALGAGVELFHDERGEPYAVLRLHEGRRILSLDSKDFGRWLSRLAWEEMQKAPGGEVVTAARLALSSIASFDGPEHPLHVRSAWMDDAIWLDLDGQRAAKVTSKEWEIIEEPPIIFRTFPHQRPLPVPTEDGIDPRKVLEFTNLRGEEASLLFICYLVAALVPDIPIAALVLHGVQGTAKTTLLKVVKSLIDPTIPEVRGGVRDQGEFALAAWQNRVLFFDNLTTMPVWLSDAMCRAVTGEGWSKRTLYTNDDLTFFEYQRAIGFAGINLVANQPDLLDRSLILPLEPIPPARRKPDRLFWQGFHEAAPDILGGLLDALVGAMEIEPCLEMLELPRMADFSRWGAAAATALGWSPGEFLDAYRRNTGRQNEAAVEGSPVAQAILTLMEDRSDEWSGTPAELLKSLEPVAEGLCINTRDRYWPKNPSWLSRRVREVEPNLLALCLEVSETRTGSSRMITLRRIPGNSVTGVTGDGFVDETPREETPNDDSVTGSHRVMTTPQSRKPRDPAVVVRSDASDGISGPSAAQQMSAFVEQQNHNSETRQDQGEPGDTGEPAQAGETPEGR